MKKHFQVRSIESKETQPVRHRVLWPHLPSVESCTIDEDQEAHAHHVGAFDDHGKLVGVCSLFQQNSIRFPHAFQKGISLYRLRTMGTLEEVRGHGAAALIVEYVCRWCSEQGAEYVWCDAREVAYGFYEHMGFEYISEEFTIENIGPHRMMARSL